MTQDEALAAAFGDASVERVTSVLDEAQLDEVEHLAGSRPDSALAIRHEARRDGRLVGTAWLDAHVVRTHAEVLMIVVEPDGRIRRIDVLAFHEPIDYVAPGRWLAQFEGEALDSELAVKRAIQPITGASLTARSVTAAARRTLALREVLLGAGAGAGGEAGEGGEATIAAP